jgi:uncharacterized protein YndB with AHSA1/START domain
MAASNAGSAVPTNPTTLDRVSDTETVITRTFNAPARLVFDAWTRADLVSRWWAPKALGASMVSCEADVRVGGRYRYVLQPPKGTPFGFSGVYLEIEPPSRLVYTSAFEFDGNPAPADAPAVTATVVFEERGDTTHLVCREVYPSKDILDQVIASGMEKGMRMTMDQLDALVVELK